MVMNSIAPEWLRATTRISPMPPPDPFSIHSFIHSFNQSIIILPALHFMLTMTIPTILPHFSPLSLHLSSDVRFTRDMV
ncbi:hypothetical protein BJX96DRAFT_57177 [Aspergillus floccosus]